MKKTYFAPVAELKALNAETILAASTIGVDNNVVSGTPGNPVEAGVRADDVTTLEQVENEWD